MSDSEYESSSSSSEEVRPTPIKVTKAKKPKINETVAKIIDKEKAKASATSKRLTEARKKPKLQTPIEPEAPAAPAVDPRDIELENLKKSFAELQSKLTAPAAAPVVQSTLHEHRSVPGTLHEHRSVPGTPEIAPKVKKPRASKAAKQEAEAVPKIPKAAKVKDSAQPAPPPRALTRDEVLRHILFS